MTVGVEQAASAFDVAIGNAPAERESGGAAPQETRAPEQMFDNLGSLDEDSPEAGGDKLPVRTPKREPVQVDLEEEDEVLLDDNGNPVEVEEEAPAEEEEEEEALNKHRDDLDDVYEVIVDGQRKEVDLQEALNGYIRQDTFYTRLNELNDYRETLQAEATKIIDQRSTYLQKLDTVEKLIMAVTPVEPDWAEEYKKNPDGAAELQKQYNGLMNQVKAIQAEKEKVKGEGSEMDAETKARYVAAENRKVLNNHPHWKDQEVMKKDLSAMFETGVKAGFDKQEIMETVDSRMISLLYKAMRYDKLQANKPKPIKTGKKSGAPGAGSTRTAPKGLTKANQQLRRTGSVEDAASVFANMITPRR